MSSTATDAPTILVTYMQKDFSCISYILNHSFTNEEAAYKAALVMASDLALNDHFQAFKNKPKHHLDFLCLVREKKWKEAIHFWNVAFGKEYGMFELKKLVSNKESEDREPKSEDFCWEE